MQIEVCGLKVNFQSRGEGKDILLLHGWGAGIPAVQPIIDNLSGNFKVTALDLPGFGASEMPAEVWGIAEYAELVADFMHKVAIKNPVLIGHSFGCRIIIYLTGKMGIAVPKIILIDSAGIRPKRTWKYYFWVYSFKIMKTFIKFFFPQNKAEQMIEKARLRYGSTDYQNAPGILKAILVRVINEDLKCYLPGIKAPTLLIWGENDFETPLADGKLMEKLIPDAGLVILKHAGHYSYLDRQYEFNLIVRNFLRPDTE